MRYVLTLLCALGISGLTYTAFRATRVARATEATAATTAAAPADGDSCPACDVGASPVLTLDVAATAPATQAKTVDVGNTKCAVMPDDDVTPGKTIDYKGKTYHFCCDECPKAFLKDPDKYIKLMNADPKKYGIK
jgi:hypothetical protein